MSFEKIVTALANIIVTTIYELWIMQHLHGLTVHLTVGPTDQLSNRQLDGTRSLSDSLLWFTAKKLDDKCQLHRHASLFTRSNEPEVYRC